MGDISGAERSLEHGKRSGHTFEGTSDAAMRFELEKDAALIKLLSGNLKDASDAYHLCAAGNPFDGAAANNVAVCIAQDGKLAEARHQLEEAFTKHPLVMLQEPVVSNMAALYEITGALVMRKKMASWCGTSAPDDFDLTCCKVGPARRSS